MNTMNIIWLVIFWAMQIVAALSFKHGSMPAASWALWFVIGNLFGASSIWFLMELYKTMNVNVAMGIAIGGAFLLAQLSTALVFKSPLSFVQYVGLVAITGGMYAISAGARVHP
jgi:multidrug transporter EmrE-like cation transporter